MSRVSTYLNFARNTEQAFEFYRSVFGGQLAGQVVAPFRPVQAPVGIASPAGWRAGAQPQTFEPVPTGRRQLVAIRRWLQALFTLQRTP